MAEIGNIQPSTISAVTLTLARNSVDSPFFPTRGWSTRLVGELGGEFLGGDQSYSFATFENRAYFRTVGKLVLSLSGEMGFLSGLNRREEVPFWKRFRLGGISQYALRGYDDYHVVPDINAPSTGGRAMTIMTTEMRYPVVQAVQVLAFFDAGNTWARPDEMDLTALRRGGGFGVRIDVPMVGRPASTTATASTRRERKRSSRMAVPFPNRRADVLGLALAVLVLAAAPVRAAEQIAVVDYQSIFDQFEGTSDAQQTLDREIKEWEKQIRHQRSAIETLEKEIESQRLMLSEERLHEKQDTLDKKKQEYERFAQDIFGVNGKASRRNAELTTPIAEKILEVIAKIGREKGLHGASTRARAASFGRRTK